jgi:predicted transcriptional regulator
VTKLLEEALARARQLPDEDQDALAVVLLSISDSLAADEMDDETRAALREGLDQARRGELVPDAEVQALWRRFGV